MNYKQSVYSIQIKSNKDDFEYIIDSFSGEREENLNNATIHICKSLFDNIQLNISSTYLINLKKNLLFIKKELEKKEVTLSIFMDLHNELVLIDNNKKDDRSYAYLRLIFKDNDNNIHIDDIPILSYNLYSLEYQIKYYANKYMLTKKIYENKKRTEIDFGFIPHILSPKASGYFIHEIIGHILESDFYSYYYNKYKNMKISNKLTVIDSISGYEDLIGIRNYDDLGIKIKPLTLVNKGKLQNILSIHENDSFDNKLYGIARRESYKFNALPRMRNTYIEPFDDMSQQDILNKYQKAILVNETISGGVNPQTGSYYLIGNGFTVKNGEIQNFIGNLTINGNIFNDILSIDYIGKNFKIFTNYCTKNGQTVRVGCGGPTISISSLSSKGGLYGRIQAY